MLTPDAFVKVEKNLKLRGNRNVQYEALMFLLLLKETKGWWARQDSNLQPDGYEPSALTS